MVFRDVEGLFTDVFLGKSVEIANHFIGKSLDIFWRLDDWDLEMAPFYLFLGAFVGKEDD